MNQVSSIGKLRQLAIVSKGKRLPSVRALAALWEISTRTVHETVQEGIRQGWLQTRRGSGIWAKGTLPARTTLPARMDAISLADQLIESIQQGKYASGQALPSPKDQAQEWSVHPATVRKAYQRLQAASLLERSGRSWKVLSPSNEHPHSKLVLLCIGAADPDGNLRIESDREGDFWREIQLEALRCGLEPRLVAWNNNTLPLDDRCHGAIVTNWHLASCQPILDDLLRARIPTSVWSATDEPLPGKQYQEVRGMWFHNLAHGREAGKTMSEFVSRLAHRKVAWISPFHGSTWSRNRLDGLKTSIKDGVEIIEFVNGWESEWDIQVLLAWAPETLRRIDLQGIEAPLNPDALRRPLVEALTRQRCLETYGPKLEQALASGATLWVAGSDLIAQWCLHWLSSRGIQVPRDLALVGFDDTRDASRLNLSSLRFDVQSMARAMIRQVLSSRQDHKLVTRYAGFVVERESTRSTG